MSHYSCSLKLLKQDSKVAGVSDPDKMKGAIYVLQGRSFMNLVLRNWEFVAEFLRVMIKMHHEDKVGKIVLKRSLSKSLFLSSSRFNFLAVYSSASETNFQSLHDKIL